MKPQKTIKQFVTKHALTKGIQLLEGEWSAMGSSFCVKPTRCYFDYYPARYVFDTYQEALQHAEELRQKKITSLQLQIHKLGKLQFPQTPPESNA